MLGIDILGQNKQWNWWELEDSQDLTKSDKSVAFEIRIKLNPFIVIHQRSIYSALDLLGDVGGLLDGLTAIGGFFMTVYCFIIGDPLECFLFSRLFKIQ